MSDTEVGSNDRIAILDGLRGFALAGIFFINIASFTVGGPPGFVESDDGVSNLVTALLLILVESKFFTLFSFLFGIGFSIQIIRANEKHIAFLPSFLRRLGVLFLFGCAHIFFLWDGDILLLYSLVGILLLFFRNASEKTLLKWVLGLLLIPVVFITLAFITITILRGMPEFGMKIQLAEAAFTEEFTQGQQETIESILTSPFLTTAIERVHGYLAIFPLLLSRVPSVLAMFLLGYLVGQKGYLYNLEHNKKLFLTISKWFLAIGLPFNILIILMFKLLPPLSGVPILFYNQYLTGPVLALGFASLFIVLFNHGRWRAILKYFVYPGRLSLSIYIIQSILYSFLFYPYGLGLYGKINTWQAVMIAVIVYPILICLSRLWLVYFRMGLLEWMWKSISKLHLQPLKR